MACSGCGEQVVAGARFCSVCGSGVAPMGSTLVPPPPPVQDGLALRSEHLYRPREGRMVAGVCAGFALRYGWDVTLVRLVLVVSVLMAGLPLVAYLVAWVVMPNGQYALPAHTGFGTTDSMKM